ncbi:MAG: GNAT family N-acetyltransferase [bacterium]|nr:GNAT family N-acetyltransferase [bacterium]
MGSEGADQLGFRNATPDDAAFIIANLEGLAEVEGRPGAVRSTPHVLCEALFGERATAECVIFESESAPVGHAWFFERVPTFSGQRVLCLEDIYIRPEHRGSGIGARAMALLAALAKSRGCRGMLWEVKAGNDGAERFYTRLGATHDPSILSYEIFGEEFERLAGGD